MLNSPSLLVLEIQCINYVFPDISGVWRLNLAMITETLKLIYLYHLLQAYPSEISSMQLKLRLAQRRDTFAAMSNMLKNHQPCQNARKLMDTSINSLFHFQLQLKQRKFCLLCIQKINNSFIDFVQLIYFLDIVQHMSRSFFLHKGPLWSRK